MTDPQVLASGAFVRVPVLPGQAAAADFNGVATPVDFSRTPSMPAGPPPSVGADSDALLRELGLNDASVKKLRDSGVIV